MWVENDGDDGNDNFARTVRLRLGQVVILKRRKLYANEIDIISKRRAAETNVLGNNQTIE